MSLRCPHCDGKSRFDSTLSGQVVDCPHCAKQLTVPGLPLHQQAPPQHQQAPPQHQQAPPQHQQAPPQHQKNPYIPPPPPPATPSGGITPALTNPLEGQPRAIAGMGPGTTLRWGWTLGGIWIIASWLSAWQMGSTLFATVPTSIDNFGASAKAGPKLSDHIEWIGAGAIPFFCLILVLLALKAMGNMKVHFGSIVFTSAMVVLPLLVANLFLFFYSFMDISTDDGAKVMSHIFFFVLAFVVASLIMLIKTSLVSVLGYAPRAAFWLVPLVLVAVGYLSMWANSLLAEFTN
ncbi:MAG: hypothetical protein VYB61_03555 [Verrucomicrobiota bacterium]|nr:hypothetical protein [Verrucomicrobiota bacterium]